MQTEEIVKTEKVDVTKCPVDLLVITLGEKGFKDKHVGADGETILSDGKVRVGIFPHDFPHDFWKGHVLAEQESNFDKWSKHFYKCDLPTEKEHLPLIIKDLEYIASSLNTKASNEYGTLVREL